MVELRGLPGGTEPDPIGVAANVDPETDELLHRLQSGLPKPARWLIVTISLLAVVQLVVVLPWLVGRDPWGLLSDSSLAHTTRDGALGLVIAAAGLLTAWSRRWALPSFLVASLALVAQSVAGLFDASEQVAEAAAGAGTSTGIAIGEIIHVPSIVLTCLIGLAAVPLAAFGPGRSR